MERGGNGGLLMAIKEKNRSLGIWKEEGEEGSVCRSALSAGPYRWLWLIGPWRHSAPIKSSWPTAHIKLMQLPSCTVLFLWTYFQKACSWASGLQPAMGLII